MAIITISREYGSGGTAVSEKVLASLGYTRVDKDLIGDVLQQYGMISFDQMVEQRHSIWDRFDQNSTDIINMLNKTILGFAKRGNCVILGRGGFVVLNGYPNVLNVLIRAPFEDRVENVMQRENITDRDNAEARVQQSDDIRFDFLRVFYGVDSNDAEWYNLVIDTSAVSPDTAAEWIVQAAKELDSRHTNEISESFYAEVDKVLDNAIDKTLCP